MKHESLWDKRMTRPKVPASLKVSKVLFLPLCIPMSCLPRTKKISEQRGRRLAADILESGALIGKRPPANTWRLFCTLIAAL